MRYIPQKTLDVIFAFAVLGIIGIAFSFVMSYYDIYDTSNDTSNNGSPQIISTEQEAKPRLPNNKTDIYTTQQMDEIPFGVSETSDNYQGNEVTINYNQEYAILLGLSIVTGFIIGIVLIIDLTRKNPNI